MDQMVLDPPSEAIMKKEGFPFPPGGWQQYHSHGKPYDYMKSDAYLNSIQLAEKRTLLELAFVHLLDTCPEAQTFVEKLSDQILVITPDDDADAEDAMIGMLFGCNNIPHKSFKVSELDISLLRPKERIVVLSENLVVSRLDAALSTALANFVETGGSIVSFNHSISFVNVLFPGILNPRIGESTADKPIYFDCHFSDKDSKIFEQYANHLQSGQQLVRCHGMQRFEVVDKAKTTVLIEEIAPQANQPLAVKFKPSTSKKCGTVYHLLTNILITKVGFQGGTSFQPLSEMLPSATKALAIKCITDLAKQPNPPEATISAWKAAVTCGFPICVNLAQSYNLFFDSFFRLLMELTP